MHCSQVLQDFLKNITFGVQNSKIKRMNERQNALTIHINKIFVWMKTVPSINVWIHVRTISRCTKHFQNTGTYSPQFLRQKRMEHRVLNEEAISLRKPIAKSISSRMCTNLLHLVSENCGKWYNIFLTFQFWKSLIMCFETYGLQMNSTRRQSLESPNDRSERCRSGGTVAVVSSWGSKCLRNAMYSWRIRESPMNTKWLCFPKNARYCKHLLVSLKHRGFSFNLLCG